MQWPESLAKQTYVTEKGLPKYLPARAVPPLPISYPPTIAKGDLVEWDTSSLLPPHGKAGLVYEVGWSLNNFKHIGDSTVYFPVAVVSWDNGESTVTSHGCLRSIGKPNEN